MAAITNPTQLGIWFDAHGSAMALYARQWLTPEAADDVVQEVFLRLAADLPRFENVKAWLFTAVRNAALSHRRSAQRRVRREQAVACERAECFAASSGDLIDASAAQDALESLAAIGERMKQSCRRNSESTPNRS